MAAATEQLDATPRAAMSGEQTAPAGGGIGKGVAAAGGLLGALAASSCCIVPLVLLSLGTGGVWMGNLAALNAYQPIFVTFATANLAVGFPLCQPDVRHLPC